MKYNLFEAIRSAGLFWAACLLLITFGGYLRGAGYDSIGTAVQCISLPASLFVVLLFAEIAPMITVRLNMAHGFRWTLMMIFLLLCVFSIIWANSIFEYE
jgi:hypothetical protein